MKLLAIVLLGAATAGCQVAARQAGFDAAVFDETAPLEASPVDATLAADARIRSGVLDVARLRSSDNDVYDPSFRILDDNGRLRLIVQDPLTHRYKLVR